MSSKVWERIHQSPLDLNSSPGLFQTDKLDEHYKFGCWHKQLSKTTVETKKISQFPTCDNFIFEIQPVEISNLNQAIYEL